MNPKTVLLVDDEPHVTQVMAMKLRAASVNVVVAGDGQEALHQVARVWPDLIVTDFQMPELSGFELAIRLRQSDATARIPILMITARGHMLTPEEVARTSIREVICKPFSPRLVLERILAILAEQPDLADPRIVAA